jgi:hypothetical protein
VGIENGNSSMLLSSITCQHVLRRMEGLGGNYDTMGI